MLLILFLKNTIIVHLKSITLDYSGSNSLLSFAKLIANGVDQNDCVSVMELILECGKRNVCGQGEGGTCGAWAW